MPIFVSRFSPVRVVGANLQQVRPNPATEIVQSAQVRAQQAEQQQAEDARTETQTERLSQVLPAQSAAARQLAGQLQNASGRPAQAGPESATPGRPEIPVQTVRPDTGIPARPETPAPKAPQLQPLPGVGAVRTQPGDVRPGQLVRPAANPVREQTLNRLAALRDVARGAVAQPAVESPVRETADQARATPLSVASAQAERPTAEQISRANTTPEIRENLRADVRDVARGLVRDAARETRENTQQTAQIASETSEVRREDVRRESREQVRELETEMRQLQRELQETERDIRQERNRAQRADSSAARSTAATAAAIGSGIDILVG